MTPKTKQQAVKYAREKARGYLDELNSCAYCTMRALQDTFDLQDENLLKAAGALTGGIGGKADTCGSLIAVAMLMGTVSGAGRHDGDKSYDKLYYSMALSRDFFNWFKEQRGTVNCNQILVDITGGVPRDFSDPVQYLEAVESGVLEKCYNVVESNAGKAAEILWDELHKRV